MISFFKIGVFNSEFKMNSLLISANIFYMISDASHWSSEGKIFDGFQHLYTNIINTTKSSLHSEKDAR